MNRKASESSGVPRLRTSVARVAPDELHFGGKSVEELLGASMWQLLSRSVAGPALDESQRVVLDRLATCGLAADPRIWPMKLAQLGASYGSVSAGLSTGYLASEASAMSYWTAGDAAQFFQSFDIEDTGERKECSKEACCNVLARRVRAGLPPGFGVHGRATDFRVTTFRMWQRREGSCVGAYQRLAERIESVVKRVHGEALRFDGLVGAVLLDLGMNPSQAATLGGAINAFPCTLGNAYEASQRGPSCLMKMPEGQVEYAGPKSRTSSRQARRKGGSRDSSE